MNIEIIRKDIALLDELGKALHDHIDYQNVLDRIQNRYEERIHREDELKKAQARRDRMGVIEITYAGPMFNCWKNDGKGRSGYRLVRPGSPAVYSVESFSDRNAAEAELNKFVDGKCDVNNWKWEERKFFVDQEMTELGIEKIPASERFEIYSFIWENCDIGRTMHEVFVYDRLTRFKSKSVADSTSFDIPVKTIYNDILNTIERGCRTEADLSRFTSGCLTSSLRFYKSKNFIFHKVNVRTADKGFLGPMYASHEIDETRKYRLTEDFEFVLEGE